MYIVQAVDHMVAVVYLLLQIYSILLVFHQLGCT
jgi:hypothetical protein